MHAIQQPTNLRMDFQSDSKGHADGGVLGLMRYVSPLVTTPIAYQSQSKAYTKSMLLLRALPSPSWTLILMSWYQVPSKAIIGLLVQVRSTEHH